MVKRPWIVRTAALLLMLGLALVPSSDAQRAQQPSPRGLLPWACVIITGDPATASPYLQDANDTPNACPNDGGTDITITGVACVADSTTGTPTITVKETNGAGSAILTGVISCSTSWTAGTLNGTPVLHSYSSLTTCSTAPCVYYIDFEQTSDGARYVVVKITGTRR